MQQCFVIALDKDRADRFTAPLCSLFWFSKARWFNKSVLFDSQGLNPPGEETKTRPKKRRNVLTFFFGLLTDFSFDFPSLLAIKRTSSDLRPPRRSQLPAVSRPLLPRLRCCSSFFFSLREPYLEYADM